MRVMIASIALVGVTFANAIPHARQATASSTRPKCLVPDAGTKDEAILARGPVYDNVPRQEPSQKSSIAVPDSLTVSVNFHIASTEADADLVTDDIIAAQFAVLRDSYAPHNITLLLNSTDRTVDNLTGSAFFVYEEGNGWTTHDKEYDAYRRRVRRGGYDALNLYFFTSYLPGATGYCEFPTVGVVDGDDQFWLDSCQISALTMPGMPADRAFEEWNAGHIAVHESGHWFGLNHTFAGGCSEPGDFVSDTPAQRSENYGCSVVDSCPGMPGSDPIHNFMGYNDDTCTTEFTPGQQQRMFETFSNFRASQNRGLGSARR